MVEHEEQTVSFQQESFDRRCQAILDFVERMEQFAQFQERLDITATLDQIWSRFLVELGNIITVEACALYLVDGQTKEFLLKDASPEAGRPLCELETERQIEAGMFAWVINRRKPSILPSLASGAEKTVVMLPLATHKQILGVVVAVASLSESSVTHENLKLLEMLGRQCSLVIENAVLYETLRKEHEALMQAQSRIVRAEKLASVVKLAAGASHEIMNPLNIISGNIQLLQLEEGLPDRVSEMLKVMKDQSRRITRIVKSLGQFSRPSVPEITRVDICDTVEKALSLFYSRLASKGIFVVKKFDGAPLEVCGDEKGLMELLVHLISNAGHAMETNGGILSLSVRKRAGYEGGGAVVEIACGDTGCGIPEENMERIFDPFFTTNQVGNGPGLGLALSLRIVEDHYGSIKVCNRAEGGAEFTVNLPAA